MEEEFKIKSNDIENLISQRISYNLKTIRNKWNFRNYDLADKLGVSNVYLHHIESGRNMPKISFLIMLHFLTGIDIKELILKQLTEDEIPHKPLEIPSIKYSLQIFDNTINNQLLSLEKIINEDKKSKTKEELQQFQTAVRKLVGEDKLKEALDLIEKEITLGKMADQVTILKGQLSELENAKLFSLVSESDLQVRKQKVRLAILSFVTSA